ncbi:uncharacterized protein LOC109705574 [Ananas comosus]|uniref:Uncharacterized protein LOC109705574 n=1 Tax=Ananas comosus TaxID=4615 RepID=A0A6P5EEP9_ANACO|nr:uncharacterized protein LOC109705574 [Ananas comosus]
MADAAEEKRSRFDDVPMEEEEAKASLLKEIESPSDDSDSKSFLEIACKSSGKVRRFAAGTEARFALYSINRKLTAGTLPALYIEAVKEGEEPVIFGPRTVLVNYGRGWKLQTVTEEVGDEDARGMQSTSVSNKKPPELQSMKKPSGRLTLLTYIGKILLTFAFMFLLGGVLTMFLETLPSLLLFATSL